MNVYLGNDRQSATQIMTTCMTVKNLTRSVWMRFATKFTWTVFTLPQIYVITYKNYEMLWNCQTEL
jgi:hypothetical protein